MQHHGNSKAKEQDHEQKQPHMLAERREEGYENLYDGKMNQIEFEGDGRQQWCFGRQTARPQQR